MSNDEMTVKNESEVMLNEAIRAEFEVLSLKFWGTIPKFDKKTKEIHKKNSTVCVAAETQTWQLPSTNHRRYCLHQLARW